MILPTHMLGFKTSSIIMFATYTFNPTIKTKYIIWYLHGSESILRWVPLQTVQAYGIEMDTTAINEFIEYTKKYTPEKLIGL